MEGSTDEHSRLRIMKRYSITSEKFAGEITAAFDDRRELVGLDMSGAEMTVQQKNWLMANKPSTEEKLFEMQRQSKWMKIVLIPESIVTFEMFWQRYDDKLNSSKKRAKQKWDKMKEAERIKAFNFIGRYFASIPQGVRKKYAETYLNAELWNN